MLKTLVQIPAFVYRKPNQVLSGFSIDKIGRVDLGNPVFPQTPITHNCCQKGIRISG